MLILYLRILVATAAVFSATGAAGRTHTLTGDVRIHKAFHSKILDNDRDIIVYLPPGYHVDKTRRYPVLYLHDGQNVFDGATSYIPGEEWRVDETAQSLIIAGKIEPLIIIGINNTGINRVNEYTPVKDARHLGGGADPYGRMIVEELKPFIDSTYRTRLGPRYTGLGGSSLGGLVSLYVGMKYPNVFGKLAVVSPVVRWANYQIIHFTEELPRKLSLRIWLDIGTKEGRDENEAIHTVNDVRLLRDTLVKKGWKLDRDVEYFEAVGAEHNEGAWASRTGSILEFLFPKK